jgi:hypothetical protein
MRDRQLRHPNRMRHVDIQRGVMPEPLHWVLGRRPRGPRRMPEAAVCGFEDAGTGADEVDAAELGLRQVKNAGEVSPVRHVCGHEDGAWSAGLFAVRIDDFLGFRAEGKIGENDVALAGEEEGGKFEVYTWITVMCEFTQYSESGYASSVTACAGEPYLTLRL